MAELFNVVFRGDIAPGNTLAEVRQRLREHFHLNEAQVDQLFSGRPVVVKKNLDATRASQFREVLVELGALTQLRAVVHGDTAPPAPPSATVSADSEPATVSASNGPTTMSPAAPGTALDAVTVEPPGADVLKPEERSRPQQRHIAVDHLSVDSAGADVLKPHERKRVVELDLDLSHLQLEPVDDR